MWVDLKVVNPLDKKTFIKMKVRSCDVGDLSEVNNDEKLRYGFPESVKCLVRTYNGGMLYISNTIEEIADEVERLCQHKHRESWE